jgi:hypothetical protein
MFLERYIHVWHHLLRDSFLHIDRLEETWETRAKDGVHGVGVMQPDKRRVDALWLKIAQKGGGYWAHSLDIPTVCTAEGKAVENLEE